MNALERRLAKVAKQPDFWAVLVVGLSVAIYALWRASRPPEITTAATSQEGSEMSSSPATTPTKSDLQSIGTYGGKEQFLRPDAANAFLQMSDAAAADGVSLFVNSAWRSYEEQAQLYQLYLIGKGNLASPPGAKLAGHENGTAVDVESAKGTNRAFKWMTANAARFGWSNTGKYFSQPEPWHWEYRPVATT